jgi:phosphatidylglycerophosphate synthase
MTTTPPRTVSSPRPPGRPSYRTALTELQHARKDGAGVPPYMRFVNRWMGRHLAAAGAATGRTPNQLTAISAGCSLLGFAVLVLARPSVASAVAVTLAFTAAFAFDSADGQLARLTGTAGPAGEWLDHVTDAARQPLLHLAVLVYLLRADGFELSWVHALPLAYLLVGSVRFLSQVLAEQLMRNAGAPPAVESGRAGLRGILQTPSDPGTLHLAFLLSASPRLFTAAYAALLVMNLLLALASFVRRYRQLRHLSTSPG